MGKAIDENKHSIFVCEYCGKEFDVYSSDLKRRTPKYCSQACYHKATATGLTYVTRICKNCGKEFSRAKGRKPTFCGLKCAGEYKRKRPRRVTVGKDGYRYIWMSDGSGVKEHRYIMEQIIGRPLSKNECVHHIDFNRQNNSPDNLMIMTIGEHSKLHREIEKKNGKEFFGRKQNG